MRNLHADQEVAVQTEHDETHWLQVGNGVRQGCLYLFRLHANGALSGADLKDDKHDFKIGGGNISNMHYANYKGHCYRFNFFILHPIDTPPCRESLLGCLKRISTSNFFIYKLVV